MRSLAACYPVLDGDVGGLGGQGEAGRDGGQRGAEGGEPVGPGGQVGVGGGGDGGEGGGELGPGGADGQDVGAVPAGRQDGRGGEREGPDPGRTESGAALVGGDAPLGAARVEHGEPPVGQAAPGGDDVEVQVRQGAAAPVELGEVPYSGGDGGQGRGGLQRGGDVAVFE